jgi:hypothetical protein
VPRHLEPAIWLEVGCGIALVAGTLVAAQFSSAVDLSRFPLCWCGVLLALDGAARLRRGRSPLARPSDWLACGAARVLFWDAFELVDLRIKNWWYTGVSPDPWAGALFGALSFATVLPAVRLGLAVLRWDEITVATAQEDPGPKPTLKKPARPVVLLLLVGLLCLGLAIALPRYAFPFAWLFLWPLCEAAAALFPRGPGLSSPLERRPVVLKLFALALPLGLLWESFNWRCPRGWVYTVPFFEHPKLFEMPLLGYLGYLPFSLEAGAALALLDRLRPHLRGGRGAAALLAVLAIHLAVDRAARGQTVLSYAPYDATGAPPEAVRLERKTHMGLPRAELVVALGWQALDDDPALVRLWIDKANSR